MPGKIIILGAGRTGSAIAADLAGRYDVTVADISTVNFFKLSNKGVHTLQADLTVIDRLSKLVTGYDLVIGTLPGHIGYKALECVIKAGKHIVDISFMPEDYFLLDDLAREKKVMAVVDCGVSPGMGNLILGYHHTTMEVTGFTCYVGGLPLNREWPFGYKIVFSPIDVIEEYTRPARYVSHGTVQTQEALSDIELVDFGRVGILEAWNSDGLRSLIRTMDIPNMVEKTLRYPGTTEYIRLLRDCGFFSKEPVTIHGQKIRPIDLTAQLLFPLWQFKPGDGDMTIMRLLIDGMEKGHEVTYVYNLYDEYDPVSDTISMARTTGYTCSAVAVLIMEGKFSRTGICPPEFIGKSPGLLSSVIRYLEERNVQYIAEKKTGQLS
jgi:saccharopine dehydrogenase-like NADP-dependent oxidoreductase